MTDDAPLSDAERTRLRELCRRTIDRLPTIKGFEEWSRRLEAAQADEALERLAVALACVVEAYQHYHGIFIVNGPTIFERMAQNG